MNSVIWFGFELKDDVNRTNERMLIDSAKNLFNGIPFDYRKELYTSVNAFVLEGPRDDEHLSLQSQTVQQARTNSRISTTKSKEEHSEAPKVQRFLFVTLFHEESHLKVLEDMVPNGLYASRSVRKAEVEFNFDKTFDEIYEESAQFAGD